MGAVYRATDRRLRREVAIKVLPPELGYSEDLRARFVREAQMAAQLSHPNIVPIYDVGDRDDLVWFIMALVEGESVRAKVGREGQQPITVVRRVLQEVAQALAYAHAKGVIHRDIKPDNILIDRGSGRAMVTDFGIAKALEGPDTALTHSGEIVGTARYMAPEQALGEGPVDARADMFALGLVGYFMLTGQHAIKGLTLPAVIAEHVRGTAVDLRSAGRTLPAQLVAPLERCLAPRPEQRFGRMEEFVEALRDLGAELPDVPAPVRKLVRETERAFFVTTISALALGLIGVEKVPPGMIALLGSGILGQWTMALEQAIRRGVNWSMIRRALYVERARRVEEVEQVGGSSDFGPVGAIATFGLILGAMILVGEGGFALSTPINIGLFWGGMFGSVLAAKVFGMPGVSGKHQRRSRPALVVGGLALILGAVLVAAVVGAMDALQGKAAGSVVAELVFLSGLGALGIYLAYRMIKKYEDRRAVRHARELVRAAEWRLPRWVDVLGSWLFGRFERDGWRIRFEREQPAAMIGAAVDLGAAQAAARRLAALYRRAPPAVSGTALLAMQLGDDLLSECRRAARELKPLGAKIARLSEGVLVSRTVAMGGSVEGELEMAERDADAVRGRGQECLDMLQALVVGLEAAMQSSDTTQLDRALRRARELSSAIRRAERVLEPAK